MTNLTFLNLKRILNEKTNCKSIIECSNPEELLIEIRDSEESRQKAVYQFVKKKNRFVEQTGSNYKPDYEPGEFVKALECFDYLVNVTINPA